MELKGKTALITGGTSGIGLELARQLIDQGANVIITGRDLYTLNKVKKDHPKVHIFPCDVSDPNSIEMLYNDVTRQFPKLNILINNAGVMRQIDLRDDTLSLQYLTQEIDVNLTGTIHMVHQFLPHLFRQSTSAIVNISSAIAFMSYSIAPVYSASKSGVHAYTKALRLQLRNTNVKVFEIIPPGVKTNLQNEFLVKPDAGDLMDVDKMVSDAIKGLVKDEEEIKPGLARLVQVLSRIAPSYIENSLGHRDFEKYRRIDKQRI